MHFKFQFIELFRFFTPQVSFREVAHTGVGIRSLLQCKALRRLWRQGMRIATPVVLRAANPKSL